MHGGIANPCWREKRSRHYWRMRKPQRYVSGKMPMSSLKSSYTKKWLNGIRWIHITHYTDAMLAYVCILLLRFNLIIKIFSYVVAPNLKLFTCIAYHSLFLNVMWARLCVYFLVYTCTTLEWWPTVQVYMSAVQTSHSLVIRVLSCKS